MAASFSTFNRTREIADDVVESLSQLAAGNSNSKLNTIDTIFVCSSYIRGDWLEHCSDLDIGIVFAPNQGEVMETPFGLRIIRNPEKDSGYQLIQAAIKEAIAGRTFYSQTPGGIDITAYSELPTNEEYIRRHKGPLLFNVFLKDFRENHRVLYGPPIKPRLPEPIHPSELLNISIDIAETRMEQLADSGTDNIHAAYLCYRAIQKAQYLFGDQTLNKLTMLSEFQKCVPDFKLKLIGEFIIRQYLATFLPVVSPVFLPVPESAAFHREMNDVIRVHLPKQQSSINNMRYRYGKN